MLSKHLFIPLAVLAVITACTPQKDAAKYAEEKKSSEFRPLDESGRTVRFYLETPADGLRQSLGMTSYVFSAEDEIYSRMETVSPQFDGSGCCYVEVAKSESRNYYMFCYPSGDKSWFLDSAPLHGLMIPYSQFVGETLERMGTYPMSGRYSDADGDRMVFREPYAVLRLIVKGSSRVTSVHLENKIKDLEGSFYMAGLSSFDPDKGYEVTEGVNFVNLNCTPGTPLSSEGTVFNLVVAPGDYKEGFILSICDTDHKGQIFETGAVRVGAGEVGDLGVFNYAPPEDQLLFERFDNMVWGGCVRDTDGLITSFAPDASTDPDNNPTARTGREDAFTRISASTPGSAVIQSTFTSGYTVAQRHAVSDSYIESRGLEAYNYLYRCQEFQGCISAGGCDATRGYVDFISFGNLDEGLYKAEVSFDIAYRYGSTDELMFQINKSGVIRSVTIDGEPMTLETTVDGNNTYTHAFVGKCIMGKKELPSQKSVSDAAGWHSVKVEIWNVCEVSAMILLGATTDASLKHGFYLDNVEVRAQKMPRGNFRVLYMNIQDGMWADQGNNFDNFVSWVKKYDPDVCVWCEARTLYKTGTDQGIGDANRILCKTMGAATDPGWEALALRYGHSHHAVGGFRDNYPQVITSKYPITTVSRMTNAAGGKYIQHGAGHFKVTVAGKEINIVSLHLWPQLYSPSSNTLASAAALEGRDHQVVEVNAILSQTNPDKDGMFLMMGDHNAISRIDSWYYDFYGYYDVVSSSWGNTPIEFNDGRYKEKWYQAHDVIIANGAYEDMIRAFWPGRFIPSTGGAGRIDFMYGTHAMTEKLVNMTSIHDSFSTITSSPVGGLSIPSDHLPIIADFNL
ncbi:MAG: hypothetical protein MJY62_02300 [Bacteroidales bacterium]|nr:hypothetical protein [Bacteroidales bacterium]